MPVLRLTGPFQCINQQVDAGIPVCSIQVQSRPVHHQDLNTHAASAAGIVATAPRVATAADGVAAAVAGLIAAAEAVY